jgi:hypothetical protein
MYFHRNIFLIIFVLNLCNCQQPADKGANDKTKIILDFIAGLPKQGMTIRVLNIYFCE